MNLRNHWVTFHIRDVYLPEPRELLFTLHGRDVLQGRIADLCNNGAERDAFAVVMVEGVDRPLVVPVEHVQVVPAPGVNASLDS